MFPIDLIVHHVLPFLWAKEAYIGIVQAIPELEIWAEPRCHHIQPHGMIRDFRHVLQHLESHEYALFRLMMTRYVVPLLRQEIDPYDSMTSGISVSAHFQEGQLTDYGSEKALVIKNTSNDVSEYSFFNDHLISPLYDKNRIDCKVLFG